MTAVNAAGQSQAAASTDASKAVVKTLGKDEFLKLMLTQLKYQNPLEPMSDNEFIAQMAQFSSLEQMQNVNTNLESLTALTQMSALDVSTSFAVSLIGKEIGYLDNGGVRQKGIVSSIQIMSGVPQLIIGDKVVGLGRVVEVKPVIQEAEEVEEVEEDQEEDQTAQEANESDQAGNAPADNNPAADGTETDIS